MLVRIQECGGSPREDRVPTGRETDAIMLWEDCAALFGKFELELAMFRHPILPPLEILVYPNTQETSHREQKRYRGQGQGSYAPRDEKKLLKPVKDGLRSFPYLEVDGCDDKAFALEVARDVSKPLQQSWRSVKTQLEHHT